MAHQRKSNVGQFILIENGGMKFRLAPTEDSFDALPGISVAMVTGSPPTVCFMFDRMYFVRSDVSRDAHMPPIRHTSPQSHVASEPSHRSQPITN